MVVVRPGDFGVTTMPGKGGWWIAVGERLDGVSRADCHFRHAFVVETVTDNTVVAIEAWPGGTRRAIYQADDPGVLWSNITLTDVERFSIVSKAQFFLGGDGRPPTPYAWADYPAIAAHRLHLPFAGLLRDYVASTDRLICSQLVDACYVAAGVKLFTDGRWSGYVIPGSLAYLIHGS